MNESDAPIAEKTSGPRHDQIAAVAYGLWMSEGCPEGRHEANWHDAEQQLTEGAGNSAGTDSTGTDQANGTPKLTEPE